MLAVFINTLRSNQLKLSVIPKNELNGRNYEPKCTLRDRFLTAQYKVLNTIRLMIMRKFLIAAIGFSCLNVSALPLLASYFTLKIENFENVSTIPES